ncbi:MAG: hypothetical protein ACYDAO_04390 [Thermoplasmataceae archaeon]
MTKEKYLGFGPMKVKLPVADLTKDDYSLPETLGNDDICPTCEETPKKGERKYIRCVICHTSLKDPETTACGIGHICSDCWDDLPEGLED